MITILGRDELSDRILGYRPKNWDWKNQPGWQEGQTKLLEKNIVISVNDRDLLFDQPHEDLHSLVFQDIWPEIAQDWPGNKLFTKEQAKDTVEFIRNRILRDDVKKHIIVHCAAGISRSAAIATFIAEKVGYPVGELKKARPFIHPNPWVLKLLREADKE